MIPNLTNTIILQAPSSFNPGGLIVMVIAIAFIVVLFLALRQVVLWYWKVDVIVKNQQEQIRATHHTNTLLNELILLQKKSNGELPNNN